MHTFKQYAWPRTTLFFRLQQSLAIKQSIQMITKPMRKRQQSQRRIRPSPGSKHGTASDMQIVITMHRAIGIYHAVSG